MSFGNEDTKATDPRPLGLTMRSDLSFQTQQFGGQRYWAVKDPVALRYFQLRDEEFSILQMIEGNSSLQSLQATFQKQFAPLRIDSTQLRMFLGTLMNQGLLVSEQPGQGSVLLSRHDGYRRRQWLAKVTGILAIRFRGIDPDRFLAWTAPRMAWMFSCWAVVIWVIALGSAATLLFVQWGVVQTRLPDFATFFSARNMLLLALAIGLTKVLHELGHGIACKHCGSECHEMGLMLLAFSPCLYCNVTDSWMLPNKWHRIMISSAGMYIELFIAAICTFLWWFSVPGWLNALFLNLVVVCSVSTLVFNGNPLLRYDGYYILADFLEVPNLRQQAQGLMRHDLSRWFLGLAPGNERLLTNRFPVFLRLYAIGATVYRFVVVGAILWFIHQMLKPHGFQVVSQALMVLVLGGLVLSPLINFVMFLGGPARARRIKWRRFVARGTAVATIIAVLFLVPLPYSVRAPAALEPANARRVHVSLPGILITQSVVIGEQVGSGDQLAVLRDLDLELEIAILSSRLNQQKRILKNLNSRRITDSSVELQIPAASQRVRDLENLLEQRNRDIQKLILRAPIAGTVLPPPQQVARLSSDGLARWTGTPLQRKNKSSFLEPDTVFCVIGDPAQFEAVLLIDETDIEGVKVGQRIELRLNQAPGRVLMGTIREIAKTNVDVAPLSLTAHEDVPTIRNEKGLIRPARTTYEARVDIKQVNQVSFSTGATGYAKIHTASRTLASRLYRFFRQTFRFEL